MVLKVALLALGGSLYAFYISVSLILMSLKKSGLREVGPSRKILHARGVGSERRKSGTRVVGTWGALGATRKIKISEY